jgi:hypothetical protein
MPGGRIVEEDPRLPPGKPLGYERKLLAREGMEGLGDGAAKLPICIMGCR